MPKIKLYKCISQLFIISIRYICIESWCSIYATPGLTGLNYELPVNFIRFISVTVRWRLDWHEVSYGCIFSVVYFPPKLYLCWKSTEFKLIMLVRVSLYSQTETRWNHIDADAHSLKLKFGSHNSYLMPFVNVVN